MKEKRIKLKNDVVIGVHAFLDPSLTDTGKQKHLLSRSLRVEEWLCQMTLPKQNAKNIPEQVTENPRRHYHDDN